MIWYAERALGVGVVGIGIGIDRYGAEMGGEGKRRGEGKS